MSYTPPLIGCLAFSAASMGAMILVFTTETYMSCDYTGVADSCQEFKAYHTNFTHETLKTYTKWHQEAQKLRLESEAEKCEIEQNLLQKQKVAETNTLQGMVDKCAQDFQTCVTEMYSPTGDCSLCDGFCDVKAWNKRQIIAERTPGLLLYSNRQPTANPIAKDYYDGKSVGSEFPPTDMSSPTTPKTLDSNTLTIAFMASFNEVKGWTGAIPAFYIAAEADGYKNVIEVMKCADNRRLQTEKGSSTGLSTCKCIGSLPDEVERVECSYDWAVDGKCVKTTGLQSNFTSYPGDFGTSCKKHLEPGHSSCFDITSDPPTEKQDQAGWCGEKWCYIDPCNCDAADATKSDYFPGTLFYSHSTCGDKNTYTAMESATNTVGNAECVATATTTGKPSPAPAPEKKDTEKGADKPSPVDLCVTITNIEAQKGVNGVSTSQQQETTRVDNAITYGEYALWVITIRGIAATNETGMMSKVEISKNGGELPITTNEYNLPWKNPEWKPLKGKVGTDVSGNTFEGVMLDVKVWDWIKPVWPDVVKGLSDQALRVLSSVWSSYLGFPNALTMMGYTNDCTEDVCPWNFKCVDPMFHKKCTKMGCKCSADPCTTTTTTTSTTTKTYGVVKKPVTTTTTTGTTTEKKFRCPQVCPAEQYITTVFAGQPVGQVYNKTKKIPQPILEWSMLNGIYVTVPETMKDGQSSTQSCRNYFSAKDRYWIKGPKPYGGGGFHEHDFSEEEFPDLGCGYTGTFEIQCHCVPLEPNFTYSKEEECPPCYPTVSIKTCNPPTYSEAVEQCLPEINVEPPKVQPFLKVDAVEVHTPEPKSFEIPDISTVSSCCETHVASVCRKEVNFPHHGNFVNGQWEPEKAYRREAAYFPLVKCEAQAQAAPRICQHAYFNVTDPMEYAKYSPLCWKACDPKEVAKQYVAFCTGDMPAQLAAEADKAHKEKIASMAAKRTQLESWVSANSPWVKEVKSVHPCIDKEAHGDAPMKSLRSGFEHLKMDKTCQIKGCKPDQCLEIKRGCKLPFMDSAPERQCVEPEPEATLTCVDRVEVSTQPIISIIFSSLFFGTSASLMISLLVCCIKQRRSQ
eukprot:gnl/MRDRNA2_/MRDRNA2_28252_c0_seq1.p1 gnl/MRDRNA2_/MRDRNA2_28252_c0~~gnl/MRDRNA2_/MRDRNA2_28252_c0_seq1.p1  ORF type:complete len:1080 (+),score=176.86 gnl/MRDRNA2_/MRDRNA2_28252_c0_seq1:90-3329(+)